MRIIVAGAWQWPWYEKACADALQKLGHEVEKFSWEERFTRFVNGRVEPTPLSHVTTIQRRLNWGPLISSINRDLLNVVKRFRPHILLAYRATHVFSSTLRKIKRISPGTNLIQYCNDDPFSQNASKFLWRHLKRAVPIYDMHFVYRQHNIGDFQNLGAKRVNLLRSYYIPEQNYQVKLKKSDSCYICDVLFAGHYEGDFRVDYLETVLKSGVKLNLFGGGWTDANLSFNSPLHKLCPVAPVVGEDYRKAISGAKIALCFLSKLNRDTYTRRNFEIPATGTFMLSEYSDDLATMFQEGYEAEFFRSKEEMIEKINYYIANDSKRRLIAERGRKRVIRDGHDVISRMQQMLDYLETANERSEK